MFTITIKRLLRKTLLNSTIGILLVLALTTLVLVTVVRSRYTVDVKFRKEVRKSRYVEISEPFLDVFLLSGRESFSNREKIRKTWAFGYTNVHFVVGKNYCAYPLENRLPHTCLPKNNSVSSDRMKAHLKQQDEITRRLQTEKNVILVPTGDEMTEIPKKLTESLNLALNTFTSKWILHTEDTVKIDIYKFEKFLKSVSFQNGTAIILSSLSHEQLTHSLSNETTVADFISLKCIINMVVSRPVAKYVVDNSVQLITYSPEDISFKFKLTPSMTFVSETDIQSDVLSTELCNISSIVQVGLCFLDNKTDKCLKRKAKSIEYLLENPSIYLNSDRFDLVVKMVYAYFYSYIPEMPNIIEESYAQHVKVWNGFNEYCVDVDKAWFDAILNCTEKRGRQSFIDSFQKTIKSIKEFGFNSAMSRIPVDKGGFVLNGAHRLAAAVVLSKQVLFDHQKYKRHWEWGYSYFKKRGLSDVISDTIMLEWMKLQTKLSSLKTHVSMISVFSNDDKKDTRMLKIVKNDCSKDNGILYEKVISLTRSGVRQLITHMYGKQSWLEVKIEQMLNKFGNKSKVNILILFIYSKEKEKLVACKNDIRKLYNDTIFKSTAHIPDSPEENLILAEMVLNPNSLQFMNHAKDPNDCNRIATELGHRASLNQISTLPGIYLGRDDIMVDSGAVLGFYGLRNRTDVDVLFLQDIDKAIIGNKNDMNIQAHAFKSNSISKERPWGEDHFNQTGPRNQWDLFYDNKYHGYCYGIKFVSLEQMVRYKIKRNEPNKDQRDVSLMNGLLERIK